MLTEKLYYKNPYEKNFTATIVNIEALPNERWSVSLDKTLFYPESGGQPFDKGIIENIPVEEVHEVENTIVHILPIKPKGTVVDASIDWNRRFDHMQQHTGQHILSAAFLKIAKAKTISFHLGSESSQIDLSIENLSLEKIEEIERLANAIIYSADQIKIHYLTKENLNQFPIRKMPSKDFLNLRVVQISDFDYSLCCGTHVSNTGEVGIIKIRSYERKNGAFRVDFVCGYRALDDYNQKHRVVNYLSTELSAPLPELINAYNRQQSKLETMSRQITMLKSELYRNLAATLHQQCEQVSDNNLIVHVLEDAFPNDVTTLVKELMTTSQTIALLAGITPDRDKVHLVFSTDNTTINMNNALKDALSLINGKGGGTAQTAQGGGNNSNKLACALEQAKSYVIEQLKSS